MPPKYVNTAEEVGKAINSLETQISIGDSESLEAARLSIVDRVIELPEDDTNYLQTGENLPIIPLNDRSDTVFKVAHLAAEYGVINSHSGGAKERTFARTLFGDEPSQFDAIHELLPVVGGVNFKEAAMTKLESAKRQTDVGGKLQQTEIEDEFLFAIRGIGIGLGLLGFSDDELCAKFLRNYAGQEISELAGLTVLHGRAIGVLNDFCNNVPLEGFQNPERAVIAGLAAADLGNEIRLRFKQIQVIQGAYEEACFFEGLNPARKPTLPQKLEYEFRKRIPLTLKVNNSQKIVIDRSKIIQDRTALKGLVEQTKQQDKVRISTVLAGAVKVKMPGK